MTYESSSAASDVSLVPFGLRIIRAMQPSAARDETAECVAKRSPGASDPHDRGVAIGIVPVIAEPAIAFAGSSRPAVGVALEFDRRPSGKSVDWTSFVLVGVLVRAAIPAAR
jgi:hypothetical protein